MYNVEDQFMGKPGLYDGDRGGKRKKGPWLMDEDLGHISVQPQQDFHSSRHQTPRELSFSISRPHRETFNGHSFLSHSQFLVKKPWKHTAQRQWSKSKLRVLVRLDRNYGTHKTRVSPRRSWNIGIQSTRSLRT
jgi:hypothetical protein